MVSPAGECICSFLAMFLRCVMTVLTEMKRWSAISLLLIPWTSATMTSRSLSLRDSCMSGYLLIILVIFCVTSFCLILRSMLRIAGTKIKSSTCECCASHSSQL